MGVLNSPNTDHTPLLVKHLVPSTTPWGQGFRVYADQPWGKQGAPDLERDHHMSMHYCVGQLAVHHGPELLCILCLPQINSKSYLLGSFGYTQVWKKGPLKSLSYEKIVAK